MRKLRFFVVVGVALVSASCLEDEPTSAQRTAPWAEFGFRALKGPLARSFNLSAVMPALPDGRAEVRLLFELQPGNADYYFLGITRERLALGKVECGVELPLGQWRASPAGPTFGAERQVTVMRRPGSISVAVDRRKVIEVADDTYVQGRTAIGTRGLPQGLLPEVRAQRTGEIYAADDFMRTNEEEAAWRPMSGRWAVESLKHPGLSANAFVYAGRATSGTPAVALLGEPWWDDYTFEVSAKPAGAEGVGLLFRYLDEANYYLFRHVASASGGLLQLVRVCDGAEKVLGEKKGFLRVDQWVRLRMTAFGDRLSTYVDDRPVFEIEDDGLAFGMVGLYAADKGGAEFDDVFVRGERGGIENFRSGRVRWYAKGGTWSVVESGRVCRLRGIGPSMPSALDAGKLIGGDGSWADYRISATVAPASSGQVGLIFRYRDESEHGELVYDLDKKTVSLALVRGGERRVVGSAPAAPLTSPRTLSVELTGGVVVCEVDGIRTLSHFDDAVPSGKAGLSVGKGAVGVFGDLSVMFPREPQPVLTKLDTFAAETTMANWAAAKSDWRPQPTRARGQVIPVYWHRAAFPGGAELQVGAFFEPARKGVLRLFTCCDLRLEPGAAELKSGYELVVRSFGLESSAATVELLRNGEAVTSGEITGLLGNSRIGIRKVADYVVAELNSKAVLAFKDASSLNGWAAGYGTENVLVRPEDVDVFCDNTVSYSFVRAAADWRTAGGEWLVTNRWRCDPRWSFFGGESKTGVAAIWNKAVLAGDLSIEFAAGIRHQRRMKYEQHASDMNLVICGDGGSLASGYGFLFGGWGNTRTAITRNGKPVAESRLRIPGGIHRRWFYFKVVRRGGHLSYYIDDRLVLEYDDPDPLPDGRLALWTWRNGLMVARVRIAAKRFGAKESFNAVLPEISDCFYNK